MPLTPGSDRATISRNISEMVHAGHPQNQAVAAALHNADRTRRASGGAMINRGREPAWMEDNEIFNRGWHQYMGATRTGDKTADPNMPTSAPGTVDPMEISKGKYSGLGGITDFDHDPMNVSARSDPPARAIGGPMPNMGGGMMATSQPTGLHPAAMHQMGMHAMGMHPMGMGGMGGMGGMHQAGMMPKRDDGGSVNTSPGLQPNAGNQSPNMQGYIQRFAQMQPEQLQEMVARLGPNNPTSALASRVLMQKRLRPDPVQPVQTAQPTPLTPGAQQQGQGAPQPGGMQPAPQSRGGEASLLRYDKHGIGHHDPDAVNRAKQKKEEEGETVPILAAGGEFVVHPHHVLRWGNGDIEKGHRALDKLVLAIRARTIKEMSKLKPPVGSKEAKAA
jgi:hypothetical protein